MTHLREIATSIRTKFDDTIETIRSMGSDFSSNIDGEQGESQGSSRFNRLRKRAVQSLGTSCSPEAAAPDEGPKAARVIDSVIGALFGDCYGSNNCSGVMSQEKEKEFMSKMYHRSFISNRQKSQHHKDIGQTPIMRSNKGLPVRSIGSASSRDECHYAQHYEDYHAQAAKAVILAREREERERGIYRKRMEDLKCKAEDEAERSAMKHHRISNKEDKSSTPLERWDQHEDNKNRQDQEVTPHKNHTSARPQHRENIKVGGNPYRLYEVSRSLSSQYAVEDHDAASYNFDDGISALSAHTLEEMAKQDVHLLRRIQSIPQEQGFDIVARPTSPVKDLSKPDEPPSPIATDESSRDSRKNESPQTTIDDDDESDYGDLVRESYPVQMSRNTSSDNHTLDSTQSSEFDLWRSQEKQYWTQVVEGDSPVELTVATINKNVCYPNNVLMIYIFLSLL